MTRHASIAAAFGALSLLAGLAPACSASSTVVDEAEPAASADKEVAESPSASAAPADAAPSGAPSASAAPAASSPAPGAKKDAGASCDAAEECASGICEGEGCGAAQGKCAPADRKCTLDLRQYCGCDGKTFSGGGNCPKKRFSKRGPCDGDPGLGPKVQAPKKP